VLAECASGFALMSFLRGCAARGGGFATRTPFGGSAPGTPGGGCAPCSPWGFPPVDGCRLRGQRPEGRGELREQPTTHPHPATNRKRQPPTPATAHRSIVAERAVPRAPDGARHSRAPKGRGELRGRPTTRPHPATNRKRQPLPLRPRGDRDGVGTRSLRDVQTSARRA
jgi:hypothetical protein